ncbi:MAG TPA: tyrosine-type recombinase/integrase [Candidatus Micrarchaeaceae archaeon]|nr:tyrosine-type recombinase/integrase [Candidatus Micrarchaeaceae archaeon]
MALDGLAAHLAVYLCGDWLFIDDQGVSLSYPPWKREFSWACARAGVELTTHGLRHYYAAALIAGGASVKPVQVVLRHASAVITLRTYAHLWPGDEDRTRSVSDAALSILRLFAD